MLGSMLVVLLYCSKVFCEDQIEFSEDDFKCSLPDVKSEDEKLDVTRFRSDFSKISEVKFPGLIGPLNERLICKIKCIDGNWVGPLCSSTPDGRFQPILRECVYRNNHPLLAISFRNASVEKETHFSHGATIVARCRNFGLYKMKGDGVLRCENGEWVPKLPECVPTTVITNFTGDAPPTILYTVVSGSAVVSPSGELFVYPESTLRLDCVSRRALGDPEWSWTQALGQHNAGVNCPPLKITSSKVRQFAQGTRLGHSVHFSCQPGYHLNGSAVLTCCADGNWSSLPPTCVETFCPMLTTLGPHLSVVEYNSSYGGRAVFQCAWGYRLVGAPGLECEQDGAWSGDAPLCTPIYCPDPIIPEHGRLLTEPSAKHGKYPVGDLVIYSCDEGNEIVGESSIVCTENGFWSHPPPFCLPPSEIRKTDTIYIDNTTLVHVEE
ncbi:locomotion-related protein hikaru genki isoform X2 [Choristoneura fumiferana]|uniref:locomotion-related protein hikaru genki isoform X2 n=1 Tax=Choristoneura fumiferana TaxID=7141 RepID=UPI003D155186